jgi:hypothetical protein
MNSFTRKLKLIRFILFTKNDYKVENNDISDGYHTFKQLYRNRLLYNAAFAKLAKTSGMKVFKSYKHSDGKLCFDGSWFIVVIQLPTGQISNHYRVANWAKFEVPYVPFAPKWDGHSTEDVLQRLDDYVTPVDHRTQGRPTEDYV